MLSTIFSSWPFLGSDSQIWGGMHEMVYTLILPISEPLMHILGFVLLLPHVTSKELPASKFDIWVFHEKLAIHRKFNSHGIGRPTSN